MSTPHLFILGRTPALALAELQSMYPDFQITVLHSRVIKVDDLGSAKLHDIVRALGGTTKIGKIIGTVPRITPEALAVLLRHVSIGQSIVFGISSFIDSIHISRQLLSEIKKILEASGKHVRFIESKQGDELTSVVVDKQRVAELLIVKEDNDYVVALTDVVQDFEEWNKRDYARPYADAKHGMLPPKVARMAVNIATEKGKRKKEKGEKILLDPFCGMGTILSEAMLCGWCVIGGDQSHDVIEKTRKNIAWLKTAYPQVSHIPCEFFTEDAAHIGTYIDPESIDAIVTEPFMGKQEQRMDIEKVRNVIKGLEKLYIGCFKHWYNLVKLNGIIVIALPEYVIHDKHFSVKKVVDNCENLGYTRLVGPIAYNRPQAVVRRNFYVFQKK